MHFCNFLVRGEKQSWNLRRHCLFQEAQTFSCGWADRRDEITSRWVVVRTMKVQHFAFWSQPDGICRVSRWSFRSRKPTLKSFIIPFITRCEIIFFHSSNKLHLIRWFHHVRRERASTCLTNLLLTNRCGSVNSAWNHKKPTKWSRGHAARQQTEKGSRRLVESTESFLLQDARLSFNHNLTTLLGNQGKVFNPIILLDTAQINLFGLQAFCWRN